MEVLKREDFCTFTALDQHLINRKKNDEKETVQWLKIKCMRFDKGSLHMSYKYNLNMPWMSVDMCRNKRKRREALEFVKQFHPDQAYNSERRISPEKHADLMKLLDYIPPIHQGFYTNLKIHKEKEVEHPDIVDSDTERAMDEYNSPDNE